jgi:hypothetical protein
MTFTGVGTQVLCSFEWLTVMSFVERNNFRVLGHCVRLSISSGNFVI